MAKGLKINLRMGLWETMAFALILLLGLILKTIEIIIASIGIFVFKVFVSISDSFKGREQKYKVREHGEIYNECIIEIKYYPDFLALNVIFCFYIVVDFIKPGSFTRLGIWIDRKIRTLEGLKIM